MTKKKVAKKKATKKAGKKRTKLGISKKHHVWKVAFDYVEVKGLKKGKKHKLGKTFHAWATLNSDGTYDPYTSIAKDPDWHPGKRVRVRFVKVE